MERRCHILLSILIFTTLLFSCNYSDELSNTVLKAIIEDDINLGKAEFREYEETVELGEELKDGIFTYYGELPLEITGEQAVLLVLRMIDTANQREYEKIMMKELCKNDGYGEYLLNTLESPIEGTTEYLTIEMKVEYLKSIDNYYYIRIFEDHINPVEGNHQTANLHYNVYIKKPRLLVPVMYNPFGETYDIN